MSSFLRTFTPLYSTNANPVYHTGGYISVVDGVRWKYGINPRSGEAIMMNKFQNYSLEGEVLYNLNDDIAEQHNLTPVPGRVVEEKYLKILDELHENQ